MQTHKFILLFGFILGWFSLVTQFILLLQNSSVDLLNSIIRFFSFFTILSNFLVSICFTTLFFKFSTLFKSYKTQTAIAVYISIVAIVYNIVLRFIWEPTGLQKIVDELLHVVNPILFVAFWFISKNKIYISYTFTFKILIFPLIYLFSVLSIGHYSKYYPYPFLEVNLIGYSNLIINCIVITVAFILISLSFIFISNRRV
ncbi:Pr6Pr family membrane protein [Flavobacterium sp.]|jgi:hypothetical protein|uniref:Pr6Pr family membrane protein n=1 Tax=Flavobacterium sp. TaxID=239 RepID=UPI0037C15148